MFPCHLPVSKTVFTIRIMKIQHRDLERDLKIISLKNFPSELCFQTPFARFCLFVFFNWLKKVVLILCNKCLQGWVKCHENLSTKEMFILGNYSLIFTTTFVCIKTRGNFKQHYFSMLLKCLLTTYRMPFLNYTERLLYITTHLRYDYI